MRIPDEVVERAFDVCIEVACISEPYGHGVGDSHEAMRVALMAVWPDTRARPAASALRFVKAAIVLAGIALAHVWWAYAADPRWLPAVVIEGLFAAAGALFCGLWACIPPEPEAEP